VEEVSGEGAVNKIGSGQCGGIGRIINGDPPQSIRGIAFTVASPWGTDWFSNGGPTQSMRGVTFKDGAGHRFANMPIWTLKSYVALGAGAPVRRHVGRGRHKVADVSIRFKNWLATCTTR
jgi:hypothetical protein